MLDVTANSDSTKTCVISDEYIIDYRSHENQQQGRRDFRFLGVLAWVAWISALIVAGFAVVSWRVYKRLGRPAGWRVIDIVGVLLALVPIVVAASYAGHQFLSR